MKLLARVAVALLAASVVSLAAGATAIGSCVFPVLADQIQRADVIAYGRVTALGFLGSPLTFRPAVVYKGTLSAGAVSVQTGPSGGVGATSVDYHAAPGTDHTLYMRRVGADLATDSCSGSHEGKPTPVEAAALGPATAVASAPGPFAELSDQPWFLPAVVAGVIGVGVLGILLRRRRSARPEPTS